MRCSSFLLECLRPAALLVSVVVSMLVPYGVAEARSRVLGPQRQDAESQRLDSMVRGTSLTMTLEQKEIERLAGADVCSTGMDFGLQGVG